MGNSDERHVDPHELISWLRSDAIPLAVQNGCNQAASLIEGLRRELAEAKKEPDTFKLSPQDELVEAAYCVALAEQERADCEDFIRNQLNAIRGFFYRSKGWASSGSRDREYFESGWTSGYAKCVWDVAQGKIDVPAELSKRLSAAPIHKGGD